MRIIDEDSEPFAMISDWWPVLKPHKFPEYRSVQVEEHSQEHDV